MVLIDYRLCESKIYTFDPHFNENLAKNDTFIQFAEPDAISNFPHYYRVVKILTFCQALFCGGYVGQFFAIKGGLV